MTTKPTLSDSPNDAHAPWAARWGPTLFLVLGVTAARLLYIAFFSPYALIEDEAHYWEWSRHLDWSYYSKGPGIAWTIALTTILAGDTEFGVRLGAPLIGAVLALAVGQLAAEASGDARARFFAAALVMLTPAFQVSSILLTIDGPYLACWALASLAAWHAFKGGSRRAWAALGAAISVGFLYKYTILLIIPGLVIYAIARRRTLAPRVCRISNLLICLAVSLMGLVPVLIWNAQHDWDTVRHLLGHLGLEGGDMAAIPTRGNKPEQYSPMWTLEYLGALVMMLGVPVWLVFHSAIDPFLRPQRDQRVREGALFCLAISAPIIIFYFLVSFMTEVEGNWPVAAYVTLIALGGWGAADGLARASTMLEAWRRLPTPRPRFGLVFARPHHPRQRAFRAAVIFGVVIGLAMTRLDLATKLPIVGPRVKLGRLTAAPELARNVADLIQQLRDETGLEPFVIAEHYGRASLMAFYLPEQPTVYCASSRTVGRRNQYDLWTQTDLDSPALIGLPAVFLRSHPDMFPGVFQSQTDLGSLPGDHKRNRHTFLGYGYLGFEQ